MVDFTPITAEELENLLNFDANSLLDSDDEDFLKLPPICEPLPDNSDFLTHAGIVPGLPLPPLPPCPNPNNTDSTDFLVETETESGSDSDMSEILEAEKPFEQQLRELPWNNKRFIDFAREHCAILPEQVTKKYSRHILRSSNLDKVEARDLDWSDFDKWDVIKCMLRPSEVRKSKAFLKVGYIQCAATLKYGGVIGIYLTRKMFNCNTSLSNQRKLDRELDEMARPFGCRVRFDVKA